MPMTASTLSTELQKIANASSEAPVRAGWALAYTKYMRGSSVLGASPASDGVLAGARSAMDSALVGISAPQVISLPAAKLIVAAVKAYWGAALLAGATVWVTVPPLVPTPFTLPVAFLNANAELAVAQALAAVFTANVAGSLPKATCYNAIAAVIHSRE